MTAGSPRRDTGTISPGRVTKYDADGDGELDVVDALGREVHIDADGDGHITRSEAQAARNK